MSVALDNGSYMSIDIPEHVQLKNVRQYLIDQDANWEHADPTYAQLFPDEALYLSKDSQSG